MSASSNLATGATSGSKNPFDVPSTPQQGASRSSRSSVNNNANPNSSNNNNNNSNNSPSSSSPSSSSEPLLWAARNVDWPIPSTLSSSHYQKLWQQSLALGQDYGISIEQQQQQHQQQQQRSNNKDTSTKSPNTPSSSAHPSSTAHAEATDASSYGLTGFMSRMIHTTNASADASQFVSTPKEDGGKNTAASGGLSANASASSMSSSGGVATGISNSNSNTSSTNTTLRPPRAHCVVAANGWIVAVLETAATPTSLFGLRLISRWNVRRGSLTGSSLSDHCALPPPILVSKQPAHLQGRIKHVLVDPTACHTLVSASNGEAYYLHSSGSSQRLVKLPGFGPLAPVHYSDGGKSKKVTGATVGGSGGATTGLHLTGIPATAVAHRRDEKSQASIQAGLSAGSYVTAIAWDKERGTEGSSKRVLLGTSLGEIYEYTFPNEEDDSAGHKKKNHDHKSTEKSGAAAQRHDNLPILLHKLSADDPVIDPSQVGAAVTGLYFERLRTGLLVICATSGRRKRTRFHSFYSPHNSSFRTVLADQQYATLVELPGSVDFADMVTVGDVFALRTAVGLYHGRIDRSLTNAASVAAAGGSSSMILDSGILPYDAMHFKKGGNKSNGSSSDVPVSLALTPHHFITLTESNQICFVNRVAQKIIQKERIDLQITTPGSSSAATSLDEMFRSAGSLLMDIRRPEQVWLRKGRHLVHISSSQEDRDVWKYTLQKCLDSPSKSSKSSTNSSLLDGGMRSPQGDPLLRMPLTEEEKAQEALFEQAKALCSNAAQKAVVTAARAEYHLSQGRAELAAKYFALCPSGLAPFADTAIRLALPKLGVDDPKSYRGSPKAWASLEASNVALITYLADKMRVGKMNDDSMTCTMLGAWLTELYLHERGERRVNAPLMESASTTAMEDSALLAQFLNNNVNNMDAKTIIKILTSHDVGAHECALYAAKSGDIATAVNAALNVGSQDTSGAYEALTILGEAPFELAEPLYYKYSSILLARAPGAAVDGFLARYSEGLSPSRLLPSVMNYERRRSGRAQRESGSSEFKEAEERKTEYDLHMDGSTEGLELRINRTMIRTTASFVDDANAAIRFLEGVIQQGCRISAIFNYLVSLYTKLDDEEPLLKFLTNHVPGTSVWNDASKKSLLSGDRVGGAEYGLSGPLDMSAALRMVLASGRHYRSAIKLYMGFGMRQQAVELALKVDPTLARELAQESIELEERKRLWLMIAKNAASDNSSRGGKDVVSRVVSVLKDCGPDVLSIEDVLPFLPDFAQIDQIKDEICEALTSYSSRIEGFLREMRDCDQACDNLRQDITQLKSRQMRVKTNARCAITNKLVLNGREPFYVFPSGYVILASAVKKEVMPYLNEKQRARVDELEGLLKQTPESNSSRDTLQAELDGLIAAECPLTGFVMIESIDRGFDDSDEIDDMISGGPQNIERAEV